MTMDVTELCRQLIRNACVNDGTAGSGHEYRSVETLADYFGQAGEIFEPAPGRQSMVYRLSGRDPDAPSLLLMGHTDVVPVNEEGWSRDPFGAEIHDGFIWGRGAVDMLNQTAAMAAAFRPYLLGDREPPPGDLVFLAVADEEAAGSLGAQPLVEHHWDRVGATYVMTEIAYPAVELGGGIGYPVAVGEKGPFWSKLRSTGTPGHGSVPYGTDNALAPMVEGLNRLFGSEMPVEISPVWRDFVASLDVPPVLAEALLDPERIDDAIERIAEDDPRMAAYVHACTHMTVSVNVLRGGVKSNMVPDRAVAQVDVRALPGQRREDVDLHLRKAMGAASDRIDIEPVADFEANASPAGGALWDVIVDSIEDQTGSRRVVPTMMPATTDARFFRARRSIAYGVGLFDDRVSFPDFLTMFHGNDERISLESLNRTAQLMDRILERWTVRG
jgi:acetylornithine deacetylase/succinyl-diaminopimelate desuccinylase-like protein